MEGKIMKYVVNAIVNNDDEKFFIRRGFEFTDEMEAFLKMAELAKWARKYIEEDETEKMTYVLSIASKEEEIKEEEFFMGYKYNEEEEDLDFLPEEWDED